MKHIEFDQPPLLRLREKLPFSIDPETSKQIDRVWEEEKAERSPHIFNGTYIAIAENEWTDKSWPVFEISYKTYLASLRDDEIRKKIPVFGVGVTGVCYLKDETSFLLGRRSNQVTLEKNQWELVPAGGVDNECFDEELGFFDYSSQLLKELREELGIEKSEVEHLKCAYALPDEKNRVVDLVMGVKVSLTLDELRERFASSSTDEHSEINVYSPSSFDKASIGSLTQYFLKSFPELLRYEKLFGAQ